MNLVAVAVPSDTTLPAYKLPVTEAPPATCRVPVILEVAAMLSVRDNWPTTGRFGNVRMTEPGTEVLISILLLTPVIWLKRKKVAGY